MVNVNKLKGRIVECGITVAELADKIGVDPSTLYRKLNNAESFTLKDADFIVKVLGLSKEDAVSIFFSQYVA